MPVKGKEEREREREERGGRREKERVFREWWGADSLRTGERKLQKALVSHILSSPFLPPLPHACPTTLHLHLQIATLEYQNPPDQACCDRRIPRM
jgi:hypothetical protein